MSDSLPPHIKKKIDALSSLPQNEKFFAILEVVEDLKASGCFAFINELREEMRIAREKENAS